MATTYQTILVLANGFIITSLLWGASLAMIIDKRLTAAAAYMGVSAVLTLFGVIHSPFENGRLFLPWAVDSPIPFRFFFAYLSVVVLLLLMARYHRIQTSKMS
jgi:AGZA family xanthine/uracil permease-like MFS transporter